MSVKYRKKPIVVEAFQLGYEKEPEWFTRSKNYVRVINEDSQSIEKIFIQTREGVMTARVGDYIIHGIAGEIYPCDRIIFEMTYERVIEND